MYDCNPKHYTDTHKNGAGILYLVVDDYPSKRYGILGKSRDKDEWEIPGGKQDPDDLSIIHTAVRESVEEFGLHPRFYKKLVDFVMKYPTNVSVCYLGGIYVLYIVKLKSFDFEKANANAACRIQVFGNLDYIGQSKLKPLVEMSEYGKLNMWEELACKKIKLNGTPIRTRDANLLCRDDLIEKVYYASRSEKIPMFNEPFEFINFGEVVEDVL